MDKNRENKKNVRALGLCSGGLDSILSAIVLRNQGVDVEWVSFETPFFTADKARKAAHMTDIKVHIKDITADYLKMLRHPPAGYGKNMNPCMDCHALMFRMAGAIMEERGFDFLFSGEVLGQRPMSQNGGSLQYVAKHSGYEQYILRPLSARCLPETPMEKSGLVDRSRLLDLNGRSRKPQMAIAARFGIQDYPSPAGGCLLTDPGFSKRLKDLFDHAEDIRQADLHLLKYGRHMRLNPATKIIIGRTKHENEKLANHYEPHQDTLIKVKSYPGPTVIMPGGGAKEMIFLAGAICAGYSKAPEDAAVSVQVASGGRVENITVLSVMPEEAKRFLIV